MAGTIRSPEEWARKMKATTSEAAATTEDELAAARKKTERLRKERLAKEAREGISELDKKKPPQKRRS